MIDQMTERFGPSSATTLEQGNQYPARFLRKGTPMTPWPLARIIAFVWTMVPGDCTRGYWRFAAGWNADYSDTHNGIAEWCEEADKESLYYRIFECREPTP